jgi:hypothetical protein
MNEHSKVGFVIRLNRFARISIALLTAALVSFIALIVVLVYSDDIPFIAYVLGGIILVASLVNIPVMVFAEREMVMKEIK